MSQSIFIQVIIIFAVMLFIQIGKRKINFIRFLLPVVIVLAVGGKYLHHIPFTASTYTVLAIVSLISVVFGVLLILTTNIIESEKELYTQTGLLYGVILLISFGSRLVLEWYMIHNQMQFGQFIVQHQISPDSIGFAFIWFITMMYIVRIVGLLIKVKIFKRQWG